MAERKKPTSTKVTVADDNYSALEAYCIGLHEYWKSLKKAGFPESICMTLIKQSGSIYWKVLLEVKSIAQLDT